MEYNSLELLIELTFETAGKFIQDLLNKLSDLGIQIPPYITWEPDLKSIFESDKYIKVFDTEFFKNNRFPYEVRFYLSSIESYGFINKPSSRWFELCILFRSSDLADDPDCDDFCLSCFKYSEKSKKVILNLGEKLHEAFPESFINFANEFNDAQVQIFLFDKDKQEGTCSDFEFAIVPRSKLGNLFTAEGKIIERINSRILINNSFL